MRAFSVLFFFFALVGAASAEEQSKGWGWIGAEFRDVGKEEAERLGWDGPWGAKVVSVDPKGPAAGKLKPGDIVLLLDGLEVESKQQFEGAIAEKSPDTEIKLKVRRGRKEQRIAVMLASKAPEQTSAVMQEAAAAPAQKEGGSEEPPAVQLTEAERELLKSQESFRDCPECPEMVVIPAGSFTMGSPENEPERSVNEGPQHSVTIAKPFAVGRFGITFAEWDACASAGGCGHYKPKDEGWGRGDRPVVNISWNDAKAYVAWLSKKTGKAYRLLSEAEREYITRAGTSTPFWWGSEISSDEANYDAGEGYNGNDSKGVSRKKTVPVKSFKPNPFGLYQVHGNVYEWVEDCWHDSYEGAPANGSAWTGGDCAYRVLRGGSWRNAPKFLRAAFRINSSPTDRDNDSGLRVARTMEANPR